MVLNSAGTEKKGNSVCIDLFTVFSTCDMDKLGKIRRPLWKERLKVSKIAEFEIVEN